MTCYHPVTLMVRPKAGGPFAVKREMEVGCGSCVGCRADQARDWMIRCMHERLMHAGAFFLTLTYNDRELPGDGSLRPKDLQIFFKALRRRVGAHEKIRYFACGEYGSATKRPHYHALLFGADFLDRVPFSVRDGYPVWRSEAVASAWPRGVHELGTVSAASAAYVAGYVEKKLKSRMADEHPFYVDQWTGEQLREQEFTRMSLRPAIGKRWIEKHWRSVYPRDEVGVERSRYKPPRYYDKWMDQDHQEQEDCVCSDCSEHQEVMLQVRETRLEEMPSLDKYTLHAKECEHVSRNELFNGRVAI